MIFGNHAASKGGKFPFVEKVTANLSITTKIAAITIPIAKCRPLPPLTFRHAITAPINAIMITENGVASR